MSVQLGIEYDSFYDESLAAVGTTGKHVYIVFTDEDGTQYVLEGGLYNEDGSPYQGSLYDTGNPITTRTGILSRDPAPDVGDFDGTYIYKDADNATTYVALDIYDPKLAWEQMQSNAVALEEAKIEYSAASGPNSNSVAATLLHYTGVDAQSLLNVQLPDDLTAQNAVRHVLSGEVSIANLGFIGIQKTIEDAGLEPVQIVEDITNAEVHLAQYGVTMDDAFHFIVDNLETPNTILDVAEQFDVTNNMLAEIHAYGTQSQTTGQDVINYFNSVGLDSIGLDAVDGDGINLVFVGMPAEGADLL